MGESSINFHQPLRIKNMEKIGIFYGSTTGNAEEVSESLASKLGDADVYNVASASEEDFRKYTNLVLVSGTYGDGDLQPDWEDFALKLKDEDFEGKTVALVGLGDQDSYSDSFCNGMSVFAELAKSAKIIGSAPNEGFEFTESSALKDGKFIGLILDQMNQPELSEDRINRWIEEVKGEFA